MPPWLRPVLTGLMGCMCSSLLPATRCRLRFGLFHPASRVSSPLYSDERAGMIKKSRRVITRFAAATEE